MRKNLSPTRPVLAIAALCVSSFCLQANAAATAAPLKSAVVSPAIAADEFEPRIVREAVAVAKALRKSDNIYDQIAAAGTLVDVGDKESLQFLADTMQHPDWSLMRSAIDMLLNVQHPAGVDLIYRCAQINPEGVFVKFLSESLASRPREDMGEFLMNALTVDDTWVKKHALQALATIQVNDKEKRIRKIAEDKDQDSMTRAYAYYVLMDTPARAQSIEKLLELAATGSPDAQEAAAVGLGLEHTAKTQAALDVLQTSENLRAQVAAVTSAAGFGEPAAIARIVDTIANGKGMDPSVAAASVRRLPGPIAMQISNQVVGHKLDTEVAARLLESWASIKADPTKMYEWGLRNDDPSVRMQAVWLVGMRQDRNMLKVIGPMLKDADSGIRGMAAWSIVRILGDKYDPGVEI